MVARLVPDPFDREGWLFELKWDGFRAIAKMDGQGATKLYSRNHNDFKKRFPPIAQALAELGRPAILDGEIVALDDRVTRVLSGWSIEGNSKGHWSITCLTC
jgi:bifunctional non-homologous end joining protein LigD